MESLLRAARLPVEDGGPALVGGAGEEDFSAQPSACMSVSVHVCVYVVSLCVCVYVCVPVFVRVCLQWVYVSLCVPVSLDVFVCVLVCSVYLYL